MNATFAEQARVDIARVIGTLECLSSMKGAVITETITLTLVSCIDLLDIISVQLAKDVSPDEGKSAAGPPETAR